MGRKQTPDVLADVMGDVRTRKLKSNKEINLPTLDTAKKTTFNLSLTTLDKLEDAWMELRRLFKDKRRITKTMIVEMAVEMALQELKEKGQNSKFRKNLD